MMEDTTDLLEAFDAEHHDPSVPVLRVMSYIRDETGLLGEYNDGDASLNLDGTAVVVVPRSSTFGAHNGLLEWVQEQADLRLGSIRTTKAADGARPTVTIRADE